MMDFLNSFKSLVKLEKVHTDNNVFKLHYKFTVIVLIVFSILLTSKQYFGDPIDCEVESKSKTVVNTYCWIYGTFIIKSTLSESLLAGLGNYAGKLPTPYEQTIGGTNNDEIITQKYYQWVCIVFCFQALLFYIPRYLWKTWEGGRLRMLVKDLNGPIVSQTWNSESKDRLLNYLMSGKYYHGWYSIRFAFCEFLNFANVLSQIILMDWFLTGNFKGYGIGLATYHNVNPMTSVFPKISKCHYYKYGYSGSVAKLDALCVLPLNIVNEKLFLFLWFWFALLTLLSFYQLIFRVIFHTSSKFRGILLRARCRYLSVNQVDTITKRFTSGDMFFIDLLAKNVNPVIYRDFLQAILNSCIDKNPNYYNHEVTIAV